LLDLSSTKDPRMTPVRDAELTELRRRLLAIDSPAAARRAGIAIAQSTQSTLSVSVADAIGLVEIAAAVARDGSPADLSTFLRTGRLPEVISLAPRQMEQVRGGRANLTAQRGIAPELVLTSWLSRADRS
jgi:hypothetical protein